MVRVSGLLAAASVSAARGEERGGAGSSQPEEPEAAESLPSREDRIGEVESDLLGEVLAHRHGRKLPGRRDLVSRDAGIYPPAFGGS
jgi:hypothetical protein